jgi:hypothetical protein
MCPCLNIKYLDKRSYTSNNGIESTDINFKNYFLCKWKPSIVFLSKIGLIFLMKFNQNIGNTVEFTFKT